MLPRSQSAFRVKPGFTLVEMLVVMLISLLCLSLALATYHALVEDARRSVCARNLKVIGQAMRGYAENYNGWLPAPASTVPEGAAWALNHPEVRQQIKNPKVYVCPSDTIVRPMEKNEKLTASGTSYSYAFGLHVQDDPEYVFLADDDGGPANEPVGPYRDETADRPATAHTADGANAVYNQPRRIRWDKPELEHLLRVRWKNGPRTILEMQKGGTDARAWNGTTGHALVN